MHEVIPAKNLASTSAANDYPAHMHHNAITTVVNQPTAMNDLCQAL